MNKDVNIFLLQPEQRNSSKVFEIVSQAVRLEFPDANIRTIRRLQYVYESHSQIISNFISEADLVIGNLDGTNVSVTHWLDIAISKNKPVIIFVPVGKAASVPENLSKLNLINLSFNDQELFKNVLSQEIKFALKPEANKISKLLLASLEIKNYRCFEHLRIEKLGRVNLIVGKNNVGKSALLEALRIYTNHRDSKVIKDILFERNEVTVKNDFSLESSNDSNLAAKNLLSDRPINSGNSISVDDTNYFVISEIVRNLNDLKNRMLDYDDKIDDFDRKFNQAVIESLGAKTTLIFYDYSANDKIPQIIYFPKKERNIDNLFINSKGLETEKLIEFWDSIVLTPSEDEVIEALSLLLPTLNRIDFIGYPKGSTNRIPMVRVNDVKDRLPLKSFGEGMTRLLGISLALVQCKDGILLIDEIESGLHFSVLPDIWKLIFSTAKELNIQVFATTHSDDCVKAFAAAAEKSSEDGILIRLERQGKKIIAKTIDEELLVNAVNYEVEVR